MIYTINMLSNNQGSEHAHESRPSPPPILALPAAGDARGRWGTGGVATVGGWSCGGAGIGGWRRRYLISRF